MLSAFLRVKAKWCLNGLSTGHAILIHLDTLSGPTSITAADISRQPRSEFKRKEAAFERGMASIALGVAGPRA
jgi:hypothetical protein